MKNVAVPTGGRFWRTLRRTLEDQRRMRAATLLRRFASPVPKITSQSRKVSIQLQPMGARSIGHTSGTSWCSPPAFFTAHLRVSCVRKCSDFRCARLTLRVATGAALLPKGSVGSKVSTTWQTAMPSCIT